MEPLILSDTKEKVSFWFPDHRSTKALYSIVVILSLSNFAQRLQFKNHYVKKKKTKNFSVQKPHGYAKNPAWGQEDLTEINFPSKIK